jgi:MFS family permease
MSIIATLQPLVLLFISSFILMIGHGLSGILLPIKLASNNTNLQLIGFVLAMYSVGFLLGAIVGKHILKQVGLVRTFTMCGSLTATAILLMGLDNNIYIWAIMRGLMGFCIASICVTLDTWFGSVSSEDNRGRILGINQIVSLSAITLGQFALVIAPISENTLFVVCGILFSSSIAPLVFISHYEPKIELPERLPFWQLFSLSPQGFITCFVCGILYSTIVNMLPLYANSEHITGLELSLFMGSAMAGGILLQLPVGYLSDHFERRKVILSSCLLLILVTCALPAAVMTGFYSIVLICNALTMGLIACLYPLSIAETFDKALKSQLVSVLSGLLCVYALGAIIGPYAASVVMQHLGEIAVFAFLLAAELTLIAFTIYRITIRAPHPAEEQEAFVMHNPNTIHEELDPRTEYRETSAHFAETIIELEKLAATHPNNAITFVRSILAKHPEWAENLAEKASQYEDIDMVLLFRAITMLNPRLAVDIAKRIAEATPEQLEELVNWLIEKEPENAMTILANISLIAVQQKINVLESLAESSPEKIQEFSQEYVDSIAVNMEKMRTPDREEVNVEEQVAELLDSVEAAAPDQIEPVTAIIDDTVGALVEDELHGK